MEDIFFNKSKEIANQFIQNIVFIDDKAYTNAEGGGIINKNDFNASEISKIFSNEGKLCAIYSPEKRLDIDKYKDVLQKADVVVLDWYLDIKDDEEKDPNADADTDEPRGEFTLALIESLLDSKMLKLIIIYTGETNLFEITDNIYNRIKNSDNFEKEECCIYSTTLRILVKAKKQGEGAEEGAEEGEEEAGAEAGEEEAGAEAGAEEEAEAGAEEEAEGGKEEVVGAETQFKYEPELRKEIVSYDDFPNLIIEEFAKMTNGLLPNFALSSISTLRKNTSRIINAFPSNLDSAYLGHKLLIGPSPDSKLLLTRIFGQAISELLEIENINTDNWVENWIDSYLEEKDIDLEEGKKLHISKDILKKMLKSESTKFKEKYKAASNADAQIKEELLKEHCTDMFICDGSTANSVNARFAILTHHKNIFKPLSGSPVLSLGTIVKQKDTDNYYICVQQRCDSVRINSKDERKFLFLPLLEEGATAPVIISEEKTLFPDISSYSLKTIKFKDPIEGCIKANKGDDGKKYYFKSIYGDEYEWIVELKELHAQRIIDAYCSKLSRIGLNESEWLRLQHNK